jgi:hypothetical protein
MRKKAQLKTRTPLSAAGSRTIEMLIPIIASYLAYRYDVFHFVTKFGVSAYILYYVIFLLAAVIAVYAYGFMSRPSRRSNIKNRQKS